MTPQSFLFEFEEKERGLVQEQLGLIFIFHSHVRYLFVADGFVEAIQSPLQ